MPGAETKGRGRAATYVNARKGGRIKAQFGYNAGRTNLLDEASRISAEPQTRNVLDEERRVRGELSRGFKGGGGAKKGKGLKGGGAVLPGKKVGIEL